MDQASPLTPIERIRQIDVIRGFALFGVLWINIFEHINAMMPAIVAEARLATPANSWIASLAGVLMVGKAQALFSLLFGYGFATIMARLESRGADASRLYLRRLSVLLLFGLVNYALLFLGDILIPYALMGFVLFLLRKLSDGFMVSLGLSLALLGEGAASFYGHLFYGGKPYWLELWKEGSAFRWDLYRTANYPGYIHEMVVGSFREWIGTPPYFAYLATILGRFMIGAWIFRQGWFLKAYDLRSFFLKCGAGCLSLGFGLGALHVMIEANRMGASWLAYLINPAEDLTIAMGYGAALVLLCRSVSAGWLTRGLAAVGQLALTNYLTHSLAYNLLLYGVGLGLLSVLDPVMSLWLAITIFSAQVAFSRFWLARFRFGPVEWLWRSLTYGQVQPMRIPA